MQNPLASKSSLGLTSTEVRERIQRGQTNRFKARVGRTYWDIIRENVFNIFNILLFSLLLVVLLLGDYPTVVFSGFTVLTNTLLGMVQEIAAKRKLDQLASLAAQEAHVWRDGRLQALSIYEIVLDDVIQIEPGDRIAVDGKIITSDALEVDESQLTGESDAVFKNPDDNVHSGSFCIAGSGKMVATQVGKDSTINKLSVIAKAYKHVLTPSQHKIATILEVSILIMVIFAPMLMIAGLLRGLDTLSLARTGVVFVSSLVPQGLVLVATLSLTIGAVKISRFKTLIQRVNAVESMANTSVLCFDKTGTITENKLAVTDILLLNGSALEDVKAKLQLYTAHLAAQNRTAGAVAAHVGGVPLLSANHVRKIREIPFTSARQWGAIEFQDTTYVLGAPERLIHDSQVSTQIHSLTTQGMRVLAFAHAPHITDTNSHSLVAQVTPLALIVMSDRIRADIHATLDQFRDLNVGLKVISGDNLETVCAITQQAGLSIETAVTGDTLETMSPEEFSATIMKTQVFARIEPETKRKIVLDLQKHGAYVAMVGDGVNDVPALKAANLAIVMNDGAQISKDIADIVLLNNAMSTLPKAFYEGREITQTIFGTTKMFLTKNFYNMLMFLFILFMMLPFPITPAQISWAAFGTVNMPAGLIAFNIMRPKYISNFRRDVIDYIVTAGTIGAVAIAILFAAAYLLTGQNIAIARSSITIFVSLFGTMIVWNVQGVEINKFSTFIEHKRVVLISSLATSLTIISFYLQPKLFEFQPPAPGSPLIILITALFLLSMVLIQHAMQDRTLLHRLWMLVERDK